jgi:hypothetical protein
MSYRKLLLAFGGFLACGVADDNQAVFQRGKLGMYTYWLPCTTFPNTSAPVQFEFYDYYANNYGETGNDAFDSCGHWNSASAGAYLNAYNNIMAAELYNISPQCRGAYNTAFSVYMAFLANTEGGSTSCTLPTGGPNSIPSP